MPDSLSAGLNVPFAQAIKAAAARGVVLPDIYYGVLQGLERQLAFSVAGVASLDQLTQVRDSLTVALQTGASFETWQAGILASGSLDLPRHRLDNIFRTNIQSCYNRGRWERFVEVKGERPYLMYDAINDNRVRPAHLAMDNIIRPVDDAFWTTHSPPNGYRSLLPCQRISGNVLLGLKAFYSGKAIKIMFESGGSISVTAQHPVLTDTGWVLSNKIKIGDKVACYSGEVSDGTPSTNLDVNNPPPTIEQVFNTLSTHIRTTAPRATMNLYGDVEFIDGDVDIVGADRELMRQIDSTTREFMDKINLAFTNETITKTSCFSPFMRIFSSPRFFCGLRRFFSPFGYFFSSMIGIPFSLSGYNDSIIRKKFRNALRTRIQFSSNALNSPAVDVHIYDAFWYWLQEFRSRLADADSTCEFRSLSFGSFKSSITDIFIGSFGVNANALSSIRDAHPGKVKFDSVVDIKLFDYRGHVYDLETKSGNILAYGGECNNHYILSNCRCRVISLTADQSKARSGQNTDNQKYFGPDGEELPQVKGGHGLDKAINEATMKPDKGWDYNPGQDLLAGVNKAIAQKQAKLSPLFNNALNTMLKSWPGTNIAKRFVVNGIKDLQPLLAEYARLYPEHLPYGVKAVLTADVTDDFFMATDGKGVFKFAEVEHNGFNSRTDLLGGLSAIKNGQPLTEHHEYAIESLWHEILHNRQTGAEALFNLDQRNPIRILSETLNQYVSRLSYGGFIDRLGGKAVHQDWVMANGYGYEKLVRNFREMLKVMAVDESINGSLLNINFHGDLLTVNYLLAEAIAKKSPYDKQLIANILQALVVDDSEFKRLMAGLNPI